MLKYTCKSVFKNIKVSTRKYNAVAKTQFSTMSKDISKDIEANRIIWVDLELTGLDENKDKILEIACIVTDGNLNIIAEGPDVIIHQSSEILDSMNEWCIKQHGQTGLTEASRTSQISLKEAENICLNFVEKYCQSGISPLAGNSVYMDRIFLRKYMPTFNSFMHYRIIDVSTVKELCKRWNYNIYKQQPKKEFLHRSINDLKESIAELKFYKDNFLIK